MHRRIGAVGVVRVQAVEHSLKFDVICSMFDSGCEEHIVYAKSGEDLSCHSNKTESV